MKREKPCKEVILEYINSTQGWTPKAQLYAIAEDWLAETVGRACRDLEEENLIQKSYYDGKYAKNLVRYARLGEAEPLPPKPKFHEEIINGVRTMVMELNTLENNDCFCGLRTQDSFKADWSFVPCDNCRKQGR